jgi:hypothetical protein
LGRFFHQVGALMSVKEGIMPDPTIPTDAASDPEEDGHGGELARTFQQIEDELPNEDDPRPSELHQDTLESRPRIGRDPKSPR